MNSPYTAKVLGMTNMHQNETNHQQARRYAACLCLSALVFACGADDVAKTETAAGASGTSGGNAGNSGGASGSTASTAGTGGSDHTAGQGGTANGIAGSNGEAGSTANTFTDPRDGQAYPTVTIGAQTWLAKNLNFALEDSSFCYADNPDNCTRYGRLYLWSVARSVCPPGFRLGSDDDWKQLEAALGMASDQIELSGYDTDRGTDQGAQLRAGGSSGFEAQLAGFRSAPGEYQALEDRTYFWTSSTQGDEVWRRRITGASSTIYRFTNPPLTFGISVRCLRI